MPDPLINHLLLAGLTVWPFARILRRAGLSPWFALLVFIPHLGLLALLAVLCHRRWPTLPPPPPAPWRKPRAV